MKISCRDNMSYRTEEWKASTLDRSISILLCCCVDTWFLHYKAALLIARTDLACPGEKVIGMLSLPSPVAMPSSSITRSQSTKVKLVKHWRSTYTLTSFGNAIGSALWSTFIANLHRSLRLLDRSSAEFPMVLPLTPGMPKIRLSPTSIFMFHYEEMMSRGSCWWSLCSK